MSNSISTQISELFAARRFAEADLLCQSASLTRPTDSMLPTICGAIRLELGDAKGAIGFLSHAIRINPSNATAHFNLGIVYRNLSQLEDALTSFRTSLRFAGPTGQILNAIGLTELALGRVSDAAKSFEHAVKCEPNSLQFMLNLAEAVRAAGDFDRTVTILNQLLIRKPNFADALNTLGAVYSETGKPKEAEDAFRKALGFDPKHVMAHNNLGVLLKNQRRFEEALREFEAATHIDASYAMAFFNKGLALKEIHKTDAALEAFREAVRLRPNLPEAHLSIGWISFDNGSLDDAQLAVARAIEVKSDYADAHSAMGAIRIKRRDWSEARACFDSRALAINPQHPEALVGLGQVFAHQGLVSASEICFRRVIEQNPNSSVARLVFAKSLFDQNRLDEAESCCREITGANSDNGEAFLVLGNVLAKQRRLEEAIPEFRRAIDILPESGRAYENLAEALQKLGRKDECDELVARLNALTSSSDETTSSLVKRLSSIAQITGQIEPFERALDLAITSGHIQDISFYTLLTPGMMISEVQAVSMLKHMNSLEKNANSFERSPFHRARSVLLHQLGDYEHAWQDLSLANRLVIEEMELNSRPRNDHQQKQLDQVHNANEIIFPEAEFDCRSVFIMGISRSGKSTLESCLASAKEWTALDEYPAIEETFRHLGITPEIVDSTPTHDQRQELAIRFAERCRRYARRGTFSYTAPGLIKYAKFLAETVPGTHFIFVQRNELDVLFRCLQKAYKRGNYYSYQINECMAYIYWYREMVAQLMARLGPRVKTISYEEFVMHPTETIASLWNWLGVESPEQNCFSVFNDTGCSEPYHGLIRAALDQESDADRKTASEAFLL